MRTLDKRSDRIDDELNFLEDSLHEGPIKSVRGVVANVTWNRFMNDGDAKLYVPIIQLAIRVGKGCFKDQEWSALSDTLPIQSKHCGRTVFLATAYELYVEVLRDGENDVQQLVLAPVRQLRKYGEQWVKYSMGTVEGLKTEYGISYRIGNTKESAAGLGKLGYGFGYDESRGLSLVWPRTAGEVRDCEDKVVQSVPQVCEAITQKERPSVSPWLTSELRTKIVLGEILILLIDNSVRVVINPSGYLRVQSIKVEMSPSELCIYAV